MSSILQLLGSANPFQLPFANDPYVWSSAQGLANGTGIYLPTTLNDGNCIVVNTALQSVFMYSSNGSGVWVHGFNSIVPALPSSGVSAQCWMDSVSSILYLVFFVASTSTIYPATISIPSGSSASLGSGISIPTSSQITCLLRSSLGSGDFQIGFTPTASIPPEVLSFSSTSGAVTVAASAITSSGTPTGSTQTYKSADGTIILGTPVFNGTGSGIAMSSVAIPIFRGGKGAILPVNNGTEYFAINAVGTSGSSFNLVQIAGTAVVSPARLIPTMLRTTFDTYLANSATALGI